MPVWAVTFHVRVWHLHKSQILEFSRHFAQIGCYKKNIPLCIFPFPATNNISVVAVPISEVDATVATLNSVF